MSLRHAERGPLAVGLLIAPGDSVHDLALMQQDAIVFSRGDAGLYIAAGGADARQRILQTDFASRAINFAQIAERFAYQFFGIFIQLGRQRHVLRGAVLYTAVVVSLNGFLGPLWGAEGEWYSPEHPISERRSSTTGNARIIFLLIIVITAAIGAIYGRNNTTCRSPSD